MPRIDYIDDSEKTPQIAAMIDVREKDGCAGSACCEHYDAKRGRHGLGRLLE